MTRCPTTASWIFRGHKDGLIADISWGFANARSDVQADWIRRGPIVEIRGIQMKLLPAEDLIRAKLYIV